MSHQLVILLFQSPTTILQALRKSVNFTSLSLFLAAFASCLKYTASGVVRCPL
ncbi:MAG: hypothetical protein LBB41_04385 [Prevotellaceae bacterium]|nr:hypothetical protein [Prevotellaceae bacterium]